MSVQAAAAAVRGQIATDFHVRVSRDHAFLAAVAHEAGLAPNEVNLAAVAMLLDAGGMPTKQEYPKAKYRGAETRVIHSEAEEGELGADWSDQAPPPVDPAQGQAANAGPADPAEATGAKKRKS